MARGGSLALVGNSPRDGVSIKTLVVVAPYHHMVRGGSLALVGNSPRDGVSIKTLVVVAPYHHYPLYE